MTDAELLAALVPDPRLTPTERSAFVDMHACLTPDRSLTHGQRAWAQGVGARLGLPGVGKPHTSVPRYGQRQPWDPSTKARKTSGAKLEALARELSAEIREIERRKRAPKGRAA